MAKPDVATDGSPTDIMAFAPGATSAGPAAWWVVRDPLSELDQPQEPMEIEPAPVTNAYADIERDSECVCPPRLRRGRLSSLVATNDQQHPVELQDPERDVTGCLAPVRLRPQKSMHNRAALIPIAVPQLN